jgi:hypothetical protein
VSKPAFTAATHTAYLVLAAIAAVATLLAASQKREAAPGR